MPHAFATITAAARISRQRGQEDMIEQSGAVVSTGTHKVERRFRVLIVEDNPAEAELIVEWLSSERGAGLDITHALDMKRALHACGEGEFDAVVLDLQLPDTMGAETIRSMRARCPNAAIVAYSGMDNEASRSSSLEAGADDFVSKNEADVSVLSRCVLHLLDCRKAP